MAVHLPIGVLLLYPWAELAAALTGQRVLGRAAMAMLAIGLVAAMFASATGEAAYELAVEAGVDHELLEKHEDFSGLVPWVILLVLGLRAWLDRKNWGPWMGFGLGLAMMGLVVWVGYTGGMLVYEHGVGVQSPS